MAKQIKIIAPFNLIKLLIKLTNVLREAFFTQIYDNRNRVVEKVKRSAKFTRKSIIKLNFEHKDFASINMSSHP